MVSSNLNKYFNNQQTYTSTELTIAISTTTSGAISLETKGLVGILMPAAFTGTVLTFSGSPDGTTYGNLYNADNTAYSITVAVDRFYMLNPADFLGASYVKIVSGSTEAAARILSVITRNFV